MSTLGDDLIKAMTEALAHAKGEGPASIHSLPPQREAREEANLAKVHLPPLLRQPIEG